MENLSKRLLVPKWGGKYPENNWKIFTYTLKEDGSWQKYDFLGKFEMPKNVFNNFEKACFCKKVHC